jgi:four helix bundle protein
MKITNFEDLDVWKRSRELVNEIYSLTKKQRFSKDFGLVDQIRRAAVSVMSNIAEGFERGSNTEFIRFLYIAKASCGETRSHLFIAFDQGYLIEDELEKAKSFAKSVSAMIGGFIAYLRTKLKNEMGKIQAKTVNFES